jgi:hypothetical protein
MHASANDPIDGAPLIKIRFRPLTLSLEQLVLNTWRGLLMDEASLLDDWTHKGILVGMQPIADRHWIGQFLPESHTGLKHVRSGISCWTNERLANAQQPKGDEFEISADRVSVSVAQTLQKKKTEEKRARLSTSELLEAFF